MIITSVTVISIVQIWSYDPVCPQSRRCVRTGSRPSDCDTAAKGVEWWVTLWPYVELCIKWKLIYPYKEHPIVIYTWSNDKKIQSCTTTFDHHPHHHQVLLLLVGHRASMKSFQALGSPAVPLTPFHDLPVPLISSSIVLCHVLFSLPLFLHPWGFQSNAVFSIAPTSLCNVCPIQFHFLLLSDFLLASVRWSP